jgi:hypothetical protein
MPYRTTNRRETRCSIRLKGRLAILALAAALGLGWSDAGTSAAERSHCDPSLAPSSNYPFKYVDRGDRCEGVYIRLVGSSALTMLSFTAAFSAFDPKAGQPLTISWVPPPSASDVELRALTTRQHLYYRMDTHVHAGETRYRWPTDVLGAMSLGRADIGLVGWTRQLLGGTDQDVLLPLSASPGNPPASPAGGTAAYTLLVQSAAQLSELFVTVTRLADGGAERPVQPARELGYGYYPADDVIEIPIEAPAERGVYAVQLGAKLRSGGASTLRFLFYAPGPG